MQKTCIYRITVQDQLNETDFNTSSPLAIRVVQACIHATRLTIFTDQSGMVGLISHLHQQGFVILSLIRDA